MSALSEAEIEEILEKLTELENMTVTEREKCIIPVEDVFKNKERVDLPEFFSKLARCGQHIYLKKIKKDIPISEIVRLYDKDGFYPLGEITEKDGVKYFSQKKCFR